MAPAPGRGEICTPRFGKVSPNVFRQRKSRFLAYNRCVIDRRLQRSGEASAHDLILGERGRKQGASEEGRRGKIASTELMKVDRCSLSHHVGTSQRPIYDYRGSFLFSESVRRRIAVLERRILPAGRGACHADVLERDDKSTGFRRNAPCTSSVVWKKTSTAKIHGA